MGYFNPRRHAPVTISSVCWHFVDVVWLCVFGQTRAASCLLVLALAAGMLAGCDAGREPLRTIPGGDPQRGLQTIQHVGCGACHLIPGASGADGLVGPPLNHFARRVVVAGVLPNEPAQLIRWIQSPQAVIPGNAMPDIGLTDAQARDVAAYLYTLD